MDLRIAGPMTGKSASTRTSGFRRTETAIASSTVGQERVGQAAVAAATGSRSPPAGRG